MCLQVQSHLVISLKIDRENWWVNLAEQMEEAAATCDSQRLFRLMRGTGGQRTSVSEVVCDRNEELIHGK